MSIDIVLLHYNNYFNRQIKVAGTTEADYLSEDIYYTTVSLVNFNPSDGVSTSLILGKGELPTPSKDLDTYDYLLVVDSEDTNRTVLSRWFILDRDRTRDGQYQFTLRRDVIADNYDAVKGSTTFVEKGIISDTTNPLLYNKENATFNQIKQGETLLKDSTGCGWVVGYIPQDAFNTPKIVSKDVELVSTADITVNGISTWTYYPASSMATSREIWASSSLSKQIILKTKEHLPAYVNSYAGINWPEHKIKGKIYVPQGGTVSGEIVSTTESYGDWSGVTVNVNTGAPSVSVFNAKDLANNMPSDSTLWDYADTVLDDQGVGSNVVIKESAVIDSMLALEGQTIKDTATDEYYKIHITNVTAASGMTGLDESLASTTTLINRINNDIISSWSTGGVQYNTNGSTYRKSDVQLGYNGNGYQIELTQQFTFASVEIDSNRNHVVDAPYDMFCIPYSDTKSMRVTSSDTVLCSKNLAISLAQEIAADTGSGNIYDTQLLPYCPSQELIIKNPNIYADDATIDLRDLSIDIIRDSTTTYTSVTITDQTQFEQAQANYGQIYDESYRPIYYYSASNTAYYYRNATTGAVLGAIVWCTSATRTFDIALNIPASSDAVQRKIENECDMYRLCSGNYQGIFEFNAAKSFGVTGFKVDCAFKPFNPYIHVVPRLGGLYGDGFADYNDARGLICGGDFSLAQMSNAWANYELQNKNYQQIFDRQIQNMDVMSKYANIESGLSAITGSVSGAATGAAAGMMTFGPTGAIAGGILGGAASLAGGIGDHVLGIKRQEEVKSFATDMYGYNLGNIKAIPTSLAKNTSLTPNTKIFPFIEKYSCTDIEKEALQNKLTYNGMTIMNISTINPYVGTGFFKGQIIRFNSLQDDNHMANAIYEEINKGVYI